MKLNPVQNQFTAGELTPLMYARSDIEGYAAGLKTCRNMITKNQGPVSKRPGLKYIAQIPGNYARVFPFQLSAESQLGDAFPVVMSDNGQLFVTGAEGFLAGEQQLGNPSFNDGSSGWTTKIEGTGAVNFINGTAVLTAPDTTGLVTEISRPFTITVEQQNQDWTFDFVETNQTAFVFPIPYMKIGTAPGLDDVVTGVGTFNTGTNTTLYATIGVPGGDYNDIVIPGEPTLTGSHNSTIEEASVRSALVNIGELVFAHTWNAQDIKDAWYAMPPSGEIMYILTPKKRPYKLANLGGTDIWAFDEIGFVGKPAEWDGESWPSCVTFSQGRSWWAGASAAPEKIWSSVSTTSADQYERFQPGSLANNSIILTNAKRGRIRWMEGLKNLVFGTVFGEFIITSESGLITPGDVRIEQQSANGSSQFQSLAIGNSVLYASGDGRKLRTAGFQWTEQSWSSRDVTFTNEHMSKGAPYIQSAYARNPDSVIWFVLDDGKMVGATLESFTNLIGWHRHDTDGTILSVSSLEFNGSSVVYVIVTRNGQMNLEVMSGDSRMDSFIHVTSEEKTSTVTGLDHLNGKTVSVVGDGALLQSAVVADGQVTISRPSNSVFVGLSFTSEIEPLPYEGGYPTGSAQSPAKRRSKYNIRVQDSVIPKVNGLRPPVRTAPTSMDERQPNYSGLIEVTDTGYTKDGGFNISDDTPFDLVVTGIYTEIQLNQL